MSNSKSWKPERLESCVAWQDPESCGGNKADSNKGWKIRPFPAESSYAGPNRDTPLWKSPDNFPEVGKFYWKIPNIRIFPMVLPSDARFEPLRLPRLQIVHSLQISQNLADSVRCNPFRMYAKIEVPYLTDPGLLHRVFDLHDPHYTVFHCWGYAITSLYIQEYDLNDFHLDTDALFYALVAMPSILELLIQIDHLSDLTPESETAPVPFRLRRLVLYPAFRGWPRLIALSSETLRDLALEGHRIEPLEYGSFLNAADAKTLGSVTCLRLFNLFDAAILRACSKLRTLELAAIGDFGDALYGIVLCVEAAPRTLQHLVLRMESSEPSLMLCDIMDLLGSRPPAVAGLRSVTIQPRLDRGT
ncbi:hypothetical protein EXIGLDRAFT_692764 [Exidia glandulosa HHB12029]|uniref:F-box domain-containing protein n=1 Tax=Exidia glandulosa HHB12029 TaxID=1314781 RepID=A0A166MI20_EXIGL|nr:hypothetical protein EXIGLDRAFT_692764 [Exidia glandulosa HHB12029]